MASVLAKTPKTSAELAREFSVSKATISHHIQMLRRASLLIESTTDRGVVLALDRAALESLSGAAANEMFARQNPPIIRRSRHERAAQKRKKEAGEKAHAPTGQRE
jgi:biotin operon repressor